ncbi:hypothetical protein [Zhaonella formicivorans]|jgi:tetrahydromethanopterin S-methyltransferase subunit B|nr:hypothetical protein [Zhaonella formicivorans]
MANEPQTPLLQEYPTPKNEREKAEYTWNAYFYFLLLAVIAILLTRFNLY